MKPILTIALAAASLLAGCAVSPGPDAQTPADTSCAVPAPAEDDVVMERPDDLGLEVCALDEPARAPLDHETSVFFPSFG
ncbi:MAG: hypothetical protein AAF928_13135 [Myxococcota bacterium]